MSNPPTHRQFNLEDVPPKVKRIINKTIEDSVEAMSRSSGNRYDELISELFQIIEQEKKRQRDEYPSNPPKDINPKSWTRRTVKN